MPITYSIRPAHPEAHRADVLVEVPELTGTTFDLVLPSWVPGSYHIVDYARNIDRLTARARGAGAPMPVERIDKSRWRVTHGSAPFAEVVYSVYGHEMINEGFDVTPEHLFVNAALGLPYVDGRTAEEHDVVLHVPPGWKVVTELRSVALEPPRFRARDYAELLDSPIDAGHPVEIGFHAAGVPHRVSLCGPGGNYEPHRLEADLRSIVEATARLFGGLPVRHYTFFVHLNDASDGALEHADSNSAVVPRLAFRPLSAYHHFLWIESHEYFHLFNVKRIHPKALDSIDYTTERYTKLLWAMEGTTDYYAPLLLRRAGIMSPSKYLENLADLARLFLATPGRRARGLEESSFLAWIDQYQPMEESRNRSVSYYLKGSLVSWALDLEIRHRTENRASLDTAFRALWSTFGSPGRGIGDEELLPFLSETVGIDLGPFFARYVAGTDEIDFAAFARYAGLLFAPKTKPAEPEDDGEPGWLGIEFDEHHGATRVTAVVDDGPARQAGLSPGDEIVAFDRSRILPGEFTKALTRVPAGTEVELTVFRRGWLTHVRVRTAAPPPEKYQFTPAAEPTPLERTIFESWLEAPWAPAKPKAPD